MGDPWYPVAREWKFSLKSCPCRPEIEKFKAIKGAPESKCFVRASSKRGIFVGLKGSFYENPHGIVFLGTQGSSCISPLVGVPTRNSTP